MKEENTGENRNSEKYIDLDKYETNIYNNIK